MMIFLDKTYAGIIALSPAQVRLLRASQPLNGHKGILPRGAQWRSAKLLEKHGLIQPVIVRHVGCSLGEFKLTKRGILAIKWIEARIEGRPL